MEHGVLDRGSRAKDLYIVNCADFGNIRRSPETMGPFFGSML